VAYLFDTGTLIEVLRATPSRTLVRRLTAVPTRDRWTSVVTVSQVLVAARLARKPRVMQDVVRLVAAVKVAPFDLLAAQAYAKLRASSKPAGSPDDLMIAAIALANDFTLVSRRPADFSKIPHLRVEDWTA
jgi:tRNA(fMet)-specific endonuclease VapC